MMSDLIFDFGFYNGRDTRHYLDHGFSVVAIESDSELFKMGINKFNHEINSGRLILINKLFCDHNGKEIFYVHPTNKDWSTADKQKADYWGIEYETRYVESIDYNTIVTNYGIPHYIKCDIEGLDYTLAKQLSISSIKPEYVSFELSRLDYHKTFSYLYVAGYTEYQLRNQANNMEYSSGEFGEYLPVDEWIDFDECLTRYMKYKELKAIDNINLALGWIDIHARQ